jgi:hypothetical protein
MQRSGWAQRRIFLSDTSIDSDGDGDLDFKFSKEEILGIRLGFIYHNLNSEPKLYMLISVVFASPAAHSCCTSCFWLVSGDECATYRLTNATYRFRLRVFNVISTNTICIAEIHRVWQRLIIDHRVRLSISRFTNLNSGHTDSDCTLAIHALRSGSLGDGLADTIRR